MGQDSFTHTFHEGIPHIAKARISMLACEMSFMAKENNETKLLSLSAKSIRTFLISDSGVIFKSRLFHFCSNSVVSVTSIA